MINLLSPDRIVQHATDLEKMHAEIRKAEIEDTHRVVTNEMNAVAGGVIMVKKLTGEVDPNGTNQHDSGAKLDSGKPDASLLGMFGNALLQVASVGTFGAEKYTRGGWQHVPDGINRYTAAMVRHFLKENDGPVDDDLPVLHAAQVAWNALARLELMCRDDANANEAEERGG